MVILSDNLLFKYFDNNLGNASHDGTQSNCVTKERSHSFSISIIFRMRKIICWNPIKWDRKGNVIKIDDQWLHFGIKE